ncbi:MAG: TonB-dependent receptor family protein [Saprospiraceae bacterium]|nr:TonB-dependent receptor family protein [Saprospiraceae bacterium]
MNKLLLNLVLSTLPMVLVAQQTTSLTGRILDEQSQEAIEYGTISIFLAKDSALISGTVSDEDGLFQIESPLDSIYLQAQFLGFEAYLSEVFYAPDRLDFGDISLQLNSSTLAEVEVSGRAITSSHKVDKQVFDAGQFQSAKGGTASDVLRNLPAVSINSFGEISVRGSTGFQVMINGKPVQGDPSVVLQQLPANAIDDVEVVTAPSAKYDPDGKAGIINIKTKQALTDGTFLSVNTLMGLPSIESYDNQNNTPRYGADITYSFRRGQWDISAGLDYRRYDISGRREGYVNTFLDNVLTEFPSDGERSFDETNYSGRLSVAYAPTASQTVTLGLYAGKRNKERTADILYLDQQRTRLTDGTFQGAGSYYDLFLQTGQAFQGGTAFDRLTYFNENLRVRKGDFIIGSLDYAFRFKDNSALQLSGLYERTVLGGPTDNANLDYPNTDRILQLQFNTNDNPLDGVRLQMDYRKRYGETQWESGYLYRYLQHPGDFDYFDRDLTTDQWVENPLFTNSINLTRSIHSVYSQVTGQANKLSYNLGLRLEHFDRTVTIERPDETFNLSQFNLFPSFNLGYELSDNLSLKAAYSRRIERTTTFKMTPFPEREHSETLEQGDAELLPEYIDLVEVGLVQNWGDHSVFATAYFRNIENVINRVNTVFNDTILNRIYTNAGTANALGLELGTTFFPARKWRVYLGGNLFNYQIEGDLFGDRINTSNTIFSINVNSTFNLTPTLSAQAAFNYLSERVTAQGRDSEFYNPSLTLRQTFSDKKWALALQWLNMDMGLWSANEQRITTERASFFTTTNYVYEVDIIQLSLSYQLNAASKKINLPKSEFGAKEF